MKVRRLMLVAGGCAGAWIWGVDALTTGLTWGMGCLIGWIMAHYRFGFSGPIRRTITTRDPRALYPIAVLVAALIAGSAVVLSLAGSMGLTLDLSQAPIRPSLVVGAFIFGIGMQIAGRCGSGTLVSAASADQGFIGTLLGLILGVFFASLHRPAIERFTPAWLGPINLLDFVPIWLAVVIQFGVLMGLLLLLNLWCGTRLSLSRTDIGKSAGYQKTIAGLGLAVVMLAFLLITGETWKVLWGLGISGAHLAKGLGWDPATSDFWGTSRRMGILASPADWLRHPAVVVNLGVIYGAITAGFWDSPRASQSRLGCTPVLPFLTGGLLMGYGGFLSYGCNISSFLGGVMSFSLHGWIWLLAAFFGSFVWLRARELPLTKFLRR